MDFCREHIRDPVLQSVQAFMQKPEFPSSMRTWSIMPGAALKELERRCQVPRFLAAPTDAKIRLHANLAPEFYDDPGHVNLDSRRDILVAVSMGIHDPDRSTGHPQIELGMQNHSLRSAFCKIVISYLLPSILLHVL